MQTELSGGFKMMSKFIKKMQNHLARWLTEQIKSLLNTASFAE